jgi:hypothetical protein
MRTKTSNIVGIKNVYSGLSQAGLEKEADELSNMIYALLIVTECNSIEIEFDHDVVITMSMKKIEQTQH